MQNLQSWNFFILTGKIKNIFIYIWCTWQPNKLLHFPTKFYMNASFISSFNIIMVRYFWGHICGQDRSELGTWYNIQWKRQYILHTWDSISIDIEHSPSYQTISYSQKHLHIPITIAHIFPDFHFPQLSSNIQLSKKQ